MSATPNVDRLKAWLADNADERHIKVDITAEVSYLPDGTDDDRIVTYSFDVHATEPMIYGDGPDDHGWHGTTWVHCGAGATFEEAAQRVMEMIDDPLNHGGKP